MKSSEYKQMAEVENTYWWHVGRKYIVSNILEQILPKDQHYTILNIGCGTGGTVPLLSKFGRVVNIDTSDEALSICRTLGVSNVIKIDRKALPFQKESFELAIALDVLEHIENDLEVLKEWNGLLKPGGKLVLTVPAYQWLWSEHDESLHHYRRYTASKLHQLLNLAGYKVDKRSYAIFSTFPLIVGYRLIRSILPKKERSSSYVFLPSSINSLLIGILKIEATVLKYINIPFGTSILVVAKKNDGVVKA